MHARFYRPCTIKTTILDVVDLHGGPELNQRTTTRYNIHRFKIIVYMQTNTKEQKQVQKYASL